MITLRKQHLRKKRVFLSKQQTFALFNASNIKISKISEIRLSLKNAKLYFVPSYLNPPNLAKGYPIIMIIYDTIGDLHKNLPIILTKMDCLGVSLNKKWYPINFFRKKNTMALPNQLLSLLLIKKIRFKK